MLQLETTSMRMSSMSQVLKNKPVNPFYQDGIGRRTGVVLKTDVRKDSDGFEIFDDYFSESEADNTDFSLVINKENISLNRTRNGGRGGGRSTKKKKSSPLRPMESFSRSAHTEDSLRLSTSSQKTQSSRDSGEVTGEVSEFEEGVCENGVAAGDPEVGEGSQRSWSQGEKSKVNISRKGLSDESETEVEDDDTLEDVGDSEVQSEVDSKSAGRSAQDAAVENQGVIERSKRRTLEEHGEEEYKRMTLQDDNIESSSCNGGGNATSEAPGVSQRCMLTKSEKEGRKDNSADGKRRGKSDVGGTERNISKNRSSAARGLLESSRIGEGEMCPEIVVVGIPEFGFTSESDGGKGSVTVSGDVGRTTESQSSSEEVGTATEEEGLATPEREERDAEDTDTLTKNNASKSRQWNESLDLNVDTNTDEEDASGLENAEVSKGRRKEEKKYEEATSGVGRMAEQHGVEDQDDTGAGNRIDGQSEGTKRRSARGGNISGQNGGAGKATSQDRQTLNDTVTIDTGWRSEEEVASSDENGTEIDEHDTMSAVEGEETGNRETSIRQQDRDRIQKSERIQGILGGNNDNSKSGHFEKSTLNDTVTIGHGSEAGLVDVPGVSNENDTEDDESDIVIEDSIAEVKREKTHNRKSSRPQRKEGIRSGRKRSNSGCSSKVGRSESSTLNDTVTIDTGSKAMNGPNVGSSDDRKEEMDRNGTVSKEVKDRSMNTMAPTKRDNNNEKRKSVTWKLSGQKNSTSKGSAMERSSLNDTVVIPTEGITGIGPEERTSDENNMETVEHGTRDNLAVENDLSKRSRKSGHLDDDGKGGSRNAGKGRKSGAKTRNEPDERASDENDLEMHEHGTHVTLTKENNLSRKSGHSKDVENAGKGRKSARKEDASKSQNRSRSVLKQSSHHGGDSTGMMNENEKERAAGQDALSKDTVSKSKDETRESMGKSLVETRSARSGNDATGRSKRRGESKDGHNGRGELEPNDSSRAGNRKLINATVAEESDQMATVPSDENTGGIVEHDAETEDSMSGKQEKTGGREEESHQLEGKAVSTKGKESRSKSGRGKGADKVEDPKLLECTQIVESPLQTNIFPLTKKRLSFSAAVADRANHQAEITREILAPDHQLSNIDEEKDKTGTTFLDTLKRGSGAAFSFRFSELLSSTALPDENQPEAVVDNDIMIVSDGSEKSFLAMTKGKSVARKLKSSSKGVKVTKKGSSEGRRSALERTISKLADQSRTLQKADGKVGINAKSQAGEVLSAESDIFPMIVDPPVSQESEEIQTERKSMAVSDGKVSIDSQPQNASLGDSEESLVVVEAEGDLEVSQQQAKTDGKRKNKAKGKTSVASPKSKQHTSEVEQHTNARSEGETDRDIEVSQLRADGKRKKKSRGKTAVASSIIGHHTSDDDDQQTNARSEDSGELTVEKEVDEDIEVSQHGVKANGKKKNKSKGNTAVSSSIIEQHTDARSDNSERCLVEGEADDIIDVVQPQVKADGKRKKKRKGKTDVATSIKEHHTSADDNDDQGKACKEGTSRRKGKVGEKSKERTASKKGGQKGQKRQITKTSEEEPQQELALMMHDKRKQARVEKGKESLQDDGRSGSKESEEERGSNIDDIEGLPSNRSESREQLAKSETEIGHKVGRRKSEGDALKRKETRGKKKKMSETFDGGKDGGQGTESNSRESEECQENDVDVIDELPSNRSESQGRLAGSETGVSGKMGRRKSEGDALKGNGTRGKKNTMSKTFNEGKSRTSTRRSKRVLSKRGQSDGESFESTNWEQHAGVSSESEKEFQNLVESKSGENEISKEKDRVGRKKTQQSSQSRGKDEGNKMAEEDFISTDNHDGGCSPLTDVFDDVPVNDDFERDVAGDHEQEQELEESTEVNPTSGKKARKRKSETLPGLSTGVTVNNKRSKPGNSLSEDGGEESESPDDLRSRLSKRFSREEGSRTVLLSPSDDADELSEGHRAEVLLKSGKVDRSSRPSVTKKVSVMLHDGGAVNHTLVSNEETVPKSTKVAKRGRAGRKSKTLSDSGTKDAQPKKKKLSTISLNDHAPVFTETTSKSASGENKQKTRRSSRRSKTSSESGTTDTQSDERKGKSRRKRGRPKKLKNITVSTEKNEQSCVDKSKNITSDGKMTSSRILRSRSSATSNDEGDVPTSDAAITIHDSRNSIVSGHELRKRLSPSGEGDLGTKVGEPHQESNGGITRRRKSSKRKGSFSNRAKSSQGETSGRESFDNNVTEPSDDGIETSQVLVGEDENGPFKLSIVQEVEENADLDATVINLEITAGSKKSLSESQEPSSVFSTKSKVKRGDKSKTKRIMTVKKTLDYTDQEEMDEMPALEQGEDSVYDIQDNTIVELQKSRDRTTGSAVIVLPSDTDAATSNAEAVTEDDTDVVVIQSGVAVSSGEESGDGEGSVLVAPISREITVIDADGVETSGVESSAVPASDEVTDGPATPAVVRVANDPRLPGPSSILKGSKIFRKQRRSRKDRKFRFSLLDAPKPKAWIIPPDKDSQSVRRSRRNRVRPLEWWRNERAVYERRRSGGFALKGINSPEVDWQPYMKRAARKAGGRRKERSIPITPKNLTAHCPLPEDAEEGSSDPVVVVNPETQREVMIDVMRTPDSFEYLGPDGNPPRETDQFVVTKTLLQQSFNTGSLSIRPMGEKGLQLLRYDTMVFYVVRGKLAVTIHKTTRILESGAYFFVPQGNVYNIVNLRKDEAKLIFFQHKGMPVE